ncbi:MAG: GNAT family N-acetyltransferase [Candidatus Aquirickettsiella gammari]|jgi:dTDP-4-amino-4,6-dideoxy-D-galactose acyltransferase|uniref:GNAT family N-acetyltransferase n=1 Tax=Candidatus Aquirickettsiella gammari TaxID=2016198 RepID=A0A370CFG5_9COXI|nr:MAG: GNAT family N-acetyltransferase [Candidatus Aquirickettsiella gammari]
MNNTQLLDWDSDILGISVAKILSPSLNEEKLRNCLQSLKKRGVKLVYWAIDSHDHTAKQAALACDGFLADKKITYFLDLRSLNLAFPYADVEIYPAQIASPELEGIALEIAQFSRFSNDPKLTTEQANTLYKAWINNACQKIAAKIVLVIKKQGFIIGMLSIDEKHGRGDLSLLGVAPDYQGQGLGKRLVYAALAWCIAQNYSFSQVVTHKANVKARHLYETCGFTQEKMEYFYHFWL